MTFKNYTPMLHFDVGHVSVQPLKYLCIDEKFSIHNIRIKNGPLFINFQNLLNNSWTNCIRGN